MNKSSRSIIKCIPYFLNYCNEIGLSEKTQEAYKRFLSKFIFWLKKTGRESLKPHEFTTDDVEAYRIYLSQFQDNKGKFLKTVTQNYYLIALRALLDYFRAKNIESIPKDTINLLKENKSQEGDRHQEILKFLNSEQIEQLLGACNTKNITGLRDRAILETLISTGFKVTKIRNLNRDQVKQILSKKALLWINKYLKKRQDKNKALFINYKGPKNSTGERLTARSIEKIVEKYRNISKAPISITPETLRWARAYVLANNRKFRIQRPVTHVTFRVKNYKKIKIFDHNRKKQYLSPPWHIVEEVINQEVVWLKDNIPVLPGSYKANPSFLKCGDCILRKIAILITSGKVKAIEIQTKENKDLWNNLTKRQNFKRVSRHGQEWHRKMMSIISKYFKSKGSDVLLEPILNYGRADLGILSRSNDPLYVEVGTVSLFKLWYNLSTMKNATFLIIPSETKVIEFRI